MDVDQDGNGTANVSGNSNASESNARTVTSDGKHVDIDGAPRPVANKAVSIYELAKQDQNESSNQHPGESTDERRDTD
jgi:hypothetical protein